MNNRQNKSPERMCGMDECKWKYIPDALRGKGCFVTECGGKQQSKNIGQNFCGYCGKAIRDFPTARFTKDKGSYEYSQR